MTKIHAPNPAYTAVDHYGETTLKFENGVAEFDGTLPTGVHQYLQTAGYGIDTEAPDAPATAEPADPRNLGDGTVGTKLRDAAVDARPEDYLPPTNAGEANPHGPDVVAPGIHAAQDVRPVEPGPVLDADAQEVKETAAADAATDGTPVEPVPVEKPKGNGSLEAWQDYSRAQGIDPGEHTRDELRELHAD